MDILWHFLIEEMHGTWSTFIAELLDTLLELFYRRRGSTFNIFISQPHTVSIMFISGEYGGNCMWWKGWFYQYEGVGWCIVTLEHKNNWGLRNIPWADGWSVGSRYSHNLSGLRSRNLQQMTKMTFSSLPFVLEFMVRTITAFYSGCWYIATQSVLSLPL